jgi:hypothetical protein
MSAISGVSNSSSVATVQVQEQQRVLVSKQGGNLGSNDNTQSKTQANATVQTATTGLNLVA